MSINRLVINNFRNLSKVDINPVQQGFNILYGKNGSGKTSFLEAIYYLGHRRSLRNTSPSYLINRGSPGFLIFAEVTSGQGQLITMGAQRSVQGMMRMKIAGKDVSTIADLAAILPMRLINVHSHQILSSPPTERRKYLDWGVFYHQPRFQSSWLRFKRTLQQRNFSLKRGVSAQERINWDQHLVKMAEDFHNLRYNYIENLLPRVNYILTNKSAEFFDIKDLNISYYAGWNSALSYAEVLQDNLASDIDRGYTQKGPHRADLLVKMSQVFAKDILSAGQQKLLVCGMMLAQGYLLEQQVEKKLIYLLDDLPAELDRYSRTWLLKTLSAQQAQIFITVVEEKVLDEMLGVIDMPAKLFHVKHGEINESKL